MMVPAKPPDEPHRIVVAVGGAGGPEPVSKLSDALGRRHRHRTLSNSYELEPVMKG